MPVIDSRERHATRQPFTQMSHAIIPICTASTDCHLIDKFAIFRTQTSGAFAMRCFLERDFLRILDRILEKGGGYPRERIDRTRCAFLLLFLLEPKSPHDRAARLFTCRLLRRPGLLLRNDGRELLPRVAPTLHYVNRPRQEPIPLPIIHFVGHRSEQPLVGKAGHHRDDETGKCRIILFERRSPPGRHLDQPRHITPVELDSLRRVAGNGNQI